MSDDAGSKIEIVELPKPPAETPPLNPGVQDIGCHRSWLVGFQERRTPPQVGMVAGKLQQTTPGGVQMIPVPGMMPCMGAGCMMWDGDKNQCIDRTVAEHTIGRDITVLPVPAEAEAPK